MASAQDICPLPASDSGISERVIDGDTIRLASGLQVRLVGIQAPKLPLGRAGFKAWPLGDEARDFLKNMLDGKHVVLRYGGRRRDRHGRALAHITFAGDEASSHQEQNQQWAQWQMVHSGMARVYSFADNRSCVEQLLEAERAARKAGRGMWALEAYQILKAAKPGRITNLSGSYQLVEGRIESASQHGKWVFFNFDKDWKRDFTVSIPHKSWKYFQKDGYRLSAMSGQRIRVRGWLSLWNGPMIEADHPEQIERLD